MQNSYDDADVCLSNELLVLIARLNRWSNGTIDMRLPLTQLRLLSLVEDRHGAHISTLAQDDNCTQPGMTLQVQRLEELNLVQRQPDPNDARAVLISLTDHGRSLLASVRHARAATIAPIVGELDANQRAALDAALSSLSHLLNTALAQPRPISSQQV